MKFERLSCGLQIKLAASDDEVKAGVFEGYGSVFNNIDGGGDLIAPGAFKKSLREWKQKGKFPPMLLQHGGFIGPAEDGIPVGKYTEMIEDDTGLYVKGQLFALDTQKGRYIHEGLKSGVLDGLSIGYRAVDVAYGKKPDEPRRTLKGIDLREVSIVTFPMNDKSRITAAKSIEEFNSFKDAEAYLRAGGFTDSQATAFVSRVKSLRPSDSELTVDSDVAAIANRLLSQITTR
jgi:uncharacterized protein